MNDPLVAYALVISVANIAGTMAVLVFYRDIVFGSVSISLSVVVILIALLVNRELKAKPSDSG